MELQLYGPLLNQTELQTNIMDGINIEHILAYSENSTERKYTFVMYW